MSSQPLGKRPASQISHTVTTTTSTNLPTRPPQPAVGQRQQPVRQTSSPPSASIAGTGLHALADAAAHVTPLSSQGVPAPSEAQASNRYLQNIPHAPVNPTPAHQTYPFQAPPSPIGPGHTNQASSPVHNSVSPVAPAVHDDGFRWPKPSPLTEVSQDHLPPLLKTIHTFLATNLDKLEQVAKLKGGWEKWLQVELSLHLESLNDIGKNYLIRREEKLYTYSGKDLMTARNLASKADKEASTSQPIATSGLAAQPRNKDPLNHQPYPIPNKRGGGFTDILLDPKSGSGKPAINIELKCAHDVWEFDNQGNLESLTDQPLREAFSDDLWKIKGGFQDAVKTKYHPCGMDTFNIGITLGQFDDLFDQTVFTAAQKVYGTINQTWLKDREPSAMIWWYEKSIPAAISGPADIPISQAPKRQRIDSNNGKPKM